MEIFNGALDSNALYDTWQQKAIEQNCGTFIVFTGIVRAQNHISHLSFDIYLPLLQSWFETWQKKAKEINANIFMAHSSGDVEIGKSSFMCAFIAKNRKDILHLYIDFIEDFKANAPIWKYDIIDGKRIYALDRSKEIKGARLI